MENIHMDVEGDILTIWIDLSVEGVPSASGKTVVLASTRGNAEVPTCTGFKIGLNLFRYPDADRV